MSSKYLSLSANTCGTESGGANQWDELDIGCLNVAIPYRSRPCLLIDASHVQSRAFLDGVKHKLLVSCVAMAVYGKHQYVVCLPAYALIHASDGVCVLDKVNQEAGSWSFFLQAPSQPR